MRLIDADALLRALALEPMENRTYWRANEIVLDQPTAYDIDKVVEQLEKTFDRWGLDEGKKEIMREIVKGGTE